jgi:hypothetical protein
MQVTPKGYKAGGKIMKAAKKDGKVRGDIKLGRALVEAFGSKKTINKMKSNIQDKNRVRTMNKGGGMDMGKKEEPTQWITKKEKPTQWITKKEKPKKWITKKSRGGGMDMGQMPNTVKPRPRGNPGIVENVVGKGGDYIKDLID